MVWSIGGKINELVHFRYFHHLFLLYITHSTDSNVVVRKQLFELLRQKNLNDRQLQHFSRFAENQLKQGTPVPLIKQQLEVQFRFLAK